MSVNTESHQPDIHALPEAITPELLDALRNFGVTRAYLFGSVSRGEERPDSDLDLLVEFDRDVSLFEQIDIAEHLTKLSSRKVDLLMKIHPVFEPYIRPTLVPLPL